MKVDQNTYLKALGADRDDKNQISLVTFQNNLTDLLLFRKKISQFPINHINRRSITQ